MQRILNSSIFIRYGVMAQRKSSEELSSITSISETGYYCNGCDGGTVEFTVVWDGTPLSLDDYHWEVTKTSGTPSISLGSGSTNTLVEVDIGYIGGSNGTIGFDLELINTTTEEVFYTHSDTITYVWDPQDACPAPM